MTSNKYDFIVVAIARKIRQYGFKIIYLDSCYQDISAKKKEQS